MLRRIRSFSAKSRLVTVTLQSARQVCAGRTVLSTALLPTPVGDDEAEVSPGDGVPGAGRGQRHAVQQLGVADTSDGRLKPGFTSRHAMLPDSDSLSTKSPWRCSPPRHPRRGATPLRSRPGYRLRSPAYHCHVRRTPRSCAILAAYLK